MTARTLVEKLWDAHVVKHLGDGWDLLHIDRHLLHDLSGEMAFAELDRRALSVVSPQLAFATPDHAVSSRPDRTPYITETGGRYYDRLKAGAEKWVIAFFDLEQRGQGIVHVTGPEQGLVLPGMTVICADSHTCTNGGLGALAFGVGTSECVHVLATQTLRLRRYETMRITIDGALAQGVTPKDVVMNVVRKLGAAGAVGHVIEFAGSAIARMAIEDRLTICNMAVEMGARSGIIAPDERTFEFLDGRPFAPRGKDFEQAVREWRSLKSDDDAIFDREVSIGADDIKPHITWGTSPDQVIDIDEPVPDPGQTSDIGVRDAMNGALRYMGLSAGVPLAGTPVDWVFIGSCANSRLSDLRAAANIVKGRRKAGHVSAWVVPGSENVKRQAEAEGLDQIFIDAGFEWRSPGCSMCVAANAERVPPGARCVSTSNRNFVGRQGPNARTHLASPPMAAAAAIAGAIADVRTI